MQGIITFYNKVFLTPVFYLGPGAYSPEELFYRPCDFTGRRNLNPVIRIIKRCSILNRILIRFGTRNDANKGDFRPARGQCNPQPADEKLAMDLNKIE